ncbi:DUF3987 domain-containing protein [Thioalkalicoccus limnaeus]|uniref:DUF3987 domain-containing protein n=1 Tax=Thioalkalicoccus limnaeus TaxID=120681 RepID=A0ABV4BI53_9GAMM
MGDAALTHATRGIPVFPCNPENKRPLTAHGFKDATTDKDQIRQWWQRWPNALIGMPTGAVTKVFVLDVDNDPLTGKDGESSLFQLVNGHGSLPDTVEAMTPRGGRHIYFRHPGGDVRIPNSASKLGPNLDIRGDGGYVILPPSRLPDGRCYAWEGSSDPTEGARSAAAPDWLLNAVLAPPTAEAPSAQTSAAPDQIESGRRNDTLFRLGRSLRAKGLTDGAVLAALRAENLAKCRPPLPDAEVAALAQSVCTKPPGGSAESREPDEWPDLVRLDTGRELPRLRPDLLPGWAGRYAAALAIATETPPELAGALTLAACSVPCARRMSVMVAPGHFENTNTWLAVALPPGNRKSAVQSAVCAPLVAWEREQAEIVAPKIAHAQSEAKTLQVRANAARASAAKTTNTAEIREATNLAADLEGQVPEIPALPQLWTSDATPERLGALLAEQGECMAWLSSEAGLFDLLAGRYSNGIPNLDLVLKAWSGDAERVDRGSRPPVFLLRPRLTIGLSPQPDVLRGLSMRPGFRGRGLLARFAYLLPPSPLGYRQLGADRPGARVPEGLAAEYDAGIRAMLEWGPVNSANSANSANEERPRLLRLSPAAYAEWLDFARAVEVRMRPGNDLESMTDLAAKVPGTAARYAAVMHGIEHAHGAPWETPISIDTMGRALEFAALTLEHGIAVMGLMDADPELAAARKVWQWLERGRRVDATVRQVFEGLKGTFPRVAALESALDTLVERGYVRVVEARRDGPGRKPSPTIEVRPELAEAWR